MESNLAVSHTGREGESEDWLFFQQQSLTEDSNRTHYSTENVRGNPRQADKSLRWPHKKSVAAVSYTV